MSIKKTLLNAAMPTLKKLVNALLAAWRGSHKSVIRGDYIASETTFTALGVSNTQTYTAPSDGVLVAQCKNPCDAICLRYGSDLDFGRFTAEGTYAWPVGFIPLRKGTKCAFYVAGNNTTLPVTAYLRFYPYVGS